MVASRARAIDFGILGPLVTPSIPLCLLGNVRDLLGGSDCGPNSGRERDSLMRAETSLIAKLNSLQGSKNSLFGCVGNWLVGL
jgi:hypothetical protein